MRLGASPLFPSAKYKALKMKIDWKDPVVRFAVGLTGLIIIVWFFITGDIPLLSRFVAGDPPVRTNASGETLTTATGKPIFESWLPIVKSMLFQALVWFGGALISFFGGVYHWLYGLAHKEQVTPAVETAPATETDTMLQALKAMGIAAQKGDTAAVNLNYGILRRPQLVAAISDASASGDKETMAKLYKELESLL